MNTTNYIVIEKCINCCAYEITRGKNDRQRVMDNIKERLTNPCIVASIVIDTKSRLAQTIK